LPSCWAPLGVFGAIAFTAGRHGVGSLKQLGMLVLLFYAAVAAWERHIDLARARSVLEGDAAGDRAYDEESVRLQHPVRT
jgi:hypothetical protein